jgi:hypothetical protein
MSGTPTPEYSSSPAAGPASGTSKKFSGAYRDHTANAAAVASLKSVVDNVVLNPPSNRLLKLYVITTSVPFPPGCGHPTGSAAAAAGNSASAQHTTALRKRFFIASRQPCNFSALKSTRFSAGPAGPLPISCNRLPYVG